MQQFLQQLAYQGLKAPVKSEAFQKDSKEKWDYRQFWNALNISTLAEDEWNLKKETLYFENCLFNKKVWTETWLQQTFFHQFFFLE